MGYHSDLVITDREACAAYFAAHPVRQTAPAHVVIEARAGRETRRTQYPTWAEAMAHVDRWCESAGAADTIRVQRAGRTV